MKIALFGASGRTGKEVMIQSLVKGYHVKALVRNPEAIDIRDEKLEVVPGDVEDPHSVEKTVEGADAVLVALGMSSNSKATVLSEGTRNILAAMEKFGIKRIIVVSSAGLFGAKDSSFVFGNIIRPLFLRKQFADKMRQFELLEQSDTEWVLVRPTGLVDALKTGKYHVTMDKPAGKRIARADVADFMLAQLNGSKYLRQLPIISY
jgi:putative NADH-flavin reductase